MLQGSISLWLFPPVVQLIEALWALSSAEREQMERISKHFSLFISEPRIEDELEDTVGEENYFHVSYRRGTICLRPAKEATSWCLTGVIIGICNNAS